MAEVESCNDSDDTFGPLANLVKGNVGLEYEVRMAQHLHALGVHFLPDSTQREIHLSKTPDALLVTRMLVRGLELCWVESKANFGDPETMHQNFAEQLSPYRQRYGPGLVIYWFGYVQEEAEQCEADFPGVLVFDHFPYDARPL